MTFILERSRNVKKKVDLADKIIIALSVVLEGPERSELPTSGVVARRSVP